MDCELRLARLEAEFDAFCDRRDTERNEANVRISSLEHAVERDPAGAAANLTTALERVIDVEVVIQALLLELEPMAPGITERVSQRLLEESERLADDRQNGEGVRESALHVDVLADQLQRLIPRSAIDHGLKR